MSYIVFANDSFYNTKGTGNMRKLDELDFMKIKNFCASRKK